MTIYYLSSELVFPPPDEADSEGILALGGDLSVERLLLAYKKGIFPWYSDEDPILWWSPDPRLVLFPERIKLSKSLKRILKSGKFHIQCDINFAQVVYHCANTSRKGQLGTWITTDMQEAYCNLHEAGYAHSFEAYYKGQLVGGLYGVSIGRSFFGESMFSHQSDASKVALAALVQMAQQWKFDMIDCQVPTEHLQRMGAEQITRTDFLNLLASSIKYPSIEGKWTFPGFELSSISANG